MNELSERKLCNWNKYSYSTILNYFTEIFQNEVTN